MRAGRSTPAILSASKYQLGIEYLSDRGGRFSGRTQALKESTITFDYKIASGLLMRFEWGRDFSNQPYFFTSMQNVFNKDQSTATAGLIWWWGRKQGLW
ncbi:MAG TPA: hypothetical protein VLZ81_00080 [Blastocatellia bacterium]|nr:hypothetical protein [Blastocatellia bacterium]